MTILHVLEATHGGTRRHVLDLLPALSRRGLTCELVYSPNRNPAFVSEAACLQERFGIRTHAVPMTRGFGGSSDAHALRQLRGIIKTCRPDIVHCHSTKAGLLGRLALLGLTTRPQVVYTPHCVAFDTGLPPAQRRLARLVEQRLSPLTDHFIAVSGHEARALLSRGVAFSEQLSIIHNGLNLTAFDEEMRRGCAEPNPPAPFPPKEGGEPGGAGYSCSSDHWLTVSPFLLREGGRGVGFSTAPPPFPTIGCFGRLTRQKHQALLLHALPLVQNQVPNTRLLFVGGGEDEAGLRDLARRLGVSQSVSWTGDVMDAWPHYARCDIVAQPSRWEGCPYTLLEAMAARRPIIAAPVGGVPELLRDDAGVLCRTPTAQAWASEIIALARDAQRCHELGQTARARVEREFAVEQMVEATARVYKRLFTRRES